MPSCNDTRDKTQPSNGQDLPTPCTAPTVGTMTDEIIALTDRDNIVKRYLPMVEGIAKKYARSSAGRYSWEDLRSAGLFGLWQALNGFDSSKGLFERYALPRIRGAVIDELYANIDPVRVPKDFRAFLRGLREVLNRCLTGIQHSTPLEIPAMFRKAIGQIQEANKQVRNQNRKEIVIQITSALETYANSREAKLEADYVSAKHCIEHCIEFLSIGSSARLDVAEPFTLREDEQSGEGPENSEEELERRIVLFLLMEIRRIDNGTKLLVLILKYCWSILRKELISDARNEIPTDIHDRFRALDLPQGLLEKEKLTQTEIAAIVGRTKERVTQIVNKESKRLRDQVKRFLSEEAPITKWR